MRPSSRTRLAGKRRATSRAHIRPDLVVAGRGATQRPRFRCRRKRSGVGKNPGSNAQRPRPAAPCRSARGGGAEMSATVRTQWLHILSLAASVPSYCNSMPSVPRGGRGKVLRPFRVEVTRQHKGAAPTAGQLKQRGPQTWITCLRYTLFPIDRPLRSLAVVLSRVADFGAACSQ
jgi:hypothetical protein